MSRPVITRRRLVAGTAAALGAAALPVGIVEALAAEMPPIDSAAPSAFDAAAFVSDLQRSGCRVILSWPATTFEPIERPATYFIAPCAGYTSVMSRWWGAMEACPDAHERVVAHLFALREAGV